MCIGFSSNPNAYFHLNVHRVHTHSNIYVRDPFFKLNFSNKV